MNIFKRKTEPIEKMIYAADADDYTQAVAHYNRMMDFFNNADADMIDIAIMELDIAERMVRAALLKVKNNENLKF